MWDTYKKHLFRGCKDALSNNIQEEQDGSITGDDVANSGPLELDDFDNDTPG